MNILLITSARNNPKSATWVVLDKFVRYFRGEFNAKIQIICFSSLLLSKRGELGEKTYNTFLRNGVLVSFFKHINNKYLWHICNFYAMLYADKVISQIKKNHINKLWIETDLLSLLILDRVLKKVEITYHLTVFDDPLLYKGYLPFINEISFFKNLFYNSKSIDTPTSELYNYYKSKKIISDKTKTVQSYVGIFKKHIFPPIINDKVKKIALTGSIYGIDAFEAFISATKEVLLKEDIEFHFMTKASHFHLLRLKRKYKKTFTFIRIKPFIPENKLINELQKYDLLYLPMKFDNQTRFQTNTSFPSKTHNYLASEVPIVIHAPKSSAINNFFTEKAVGCIINTLNPHEIIDSLLKLLDKKNRENLSVRINELNGILVQNNHLKDLFNLLKEV